MNPRFILTSFLCCFALCLTTAVPVFAENLLDVVEAAQNSIETKYSNPESIARNLALEQLEKIARSDKPEDQIIRAILESFPETSSELSGKSDLNSNGIPDDWEKKRNVSARFTAPESDEDSDGFTLLQEYKVDTDPLDPLSHPKYITQVYVSAVSRQRFPGLELVSVDRKDTGGMTKGIGKPHSALSAAAAGAVSSSSSTPARSRTTMSPSVSLTSRSMRRRRNPSSISGASAGTSASRAVSGSPSTTLCPA